MTETPDGGPVRGPAARQPPPRERRFSRALTDVSEPLPGELAEVEATIEALPDDLRELASYVATRRIWRIEQVLRHRTSTLQIVLHQIEDPHNQSAILRTAESLGVHAVHVVRHRTERFRPSPTISQNAHKWMTIGVHDGVDPVVGALRQRGLRLLATSLGLEADPMHAVDWTVPTAVVFGNEAAGVPPEVVAACDGEVQVPMYGFIGSYNVSVAAALLLGHAVDRRRAEWGQVGDLSEAEAMALRRVYYRRAIPRSVERALELRGGRPKR